MPKYMAYLKRVNNGEHKIGYVIHNFRPSLFGFSVPVRDAVVLRIVNTLIHIYPSQQLLGLISQRSVKCSKSLYQKQSTSYTVNLIIKLFPAPSGCHLYTSVVIVSS